MTIRDLAKELGLSTATVSVALSAHPERCHLSAVTVSRVREAAERLGYIPNQLAIKLLRKGGTDTIGILYLLGSTDDRNLPVLNQVMKYLSSRKCDYQVFSCLDIHHQPGAFRETIRYIRGMRLRTLVIIGTISEEYPLEPDLYQGLQVYVTDCDIPEKAIPDFFQYVGLTNRQAFHQWLIQGVVAQGALPIVTHEAVRVLVPDWKEEYGSVLEDVPPWSAFQVGADYGREVVKAFRAGKCRTAIFHNDRIALGAMEVLLQEGIRIPEDVQVFGYNNSEFDDYTAVPLTSVHSPAGEMTMRVLQHLVEKTPLPKCEKSTLQLVQRKSTLPLPKEPTGC